MAPRWAVSQKRVLSLPPSLCDKVFLSGEQLSVRGWRVSTVAPAGHLLVLLSPTSLEEDLGSTKASARCCMREWGCRCGCRACCPGGVWGPEGQGHPRPRRKAPQACTLSQANHIRSHTVPLWSLTPPLLPIPNHHGHNASTPTTESTPPLPTHQVGATSAAACIARPPPRPGIGGEGTP